MLRSLLCAFLLLGGVASSAAEVLPPVVAERLQTELRAFRLSAMPLDKLNFSRAEDGTTYRIVAGTFLFHISPDGQAARYDYLLAQEPYASLSEAEQAVFRRAALDAVDEADMIVFAPPPEVPVRYTLDVFSDVSCPFSAALHRDIDFFTAAGIKIRYLGFPRDGLDSLGYKKMVPVWCNPDRSHTFSEAIAGKRIKLNYCQDHPVEAQYWLGESFGFPGTPTMIQEDGIMLVGYDGDAAALLDYLEGLITP